ncbi:MAG: ketopantoate reductase C-terminal domain-containing protein [Candidatus Bathyarchaeia archaeon]
MIKALCHKDFKHSRKTEVDLLNGAIARGFKELGIETSTNKLISLIIKALESLIRIYEI